MSSPKDFHIDAIYPEPLSRLRRPMNDHSSSSSAHRRQVKKQLHRGSSGRFRTQPVTFYEIKEVDEDNLTEVETVETTGFTGSAGTICKSETDLKAKFEQFYRSIKTSNDENQPNQNPTPLISRQPLPPSKLATLTDNSNFSTNTNVNKPSPPSTEINPSSEDAEESSELQRPTELKGTTKEINSITSTSSPPVDIRFNTKSRPSL